MQWQASPSATVLRKRLELDGPKESGRVTSVVRYLPGSTFPPHPHPQGEEILVLSGVFSDEYGDYPAGSYILNPEGFEHAPRSREGCDIFVKLRQYEGAERTSVRVDTTVGSWLPSWEEGCAYRPLYESDGFSDTMRLLRMTAGAVLCTADYHGGGELFVLAGTLTQDRSVLPAGCWARCEPGEPISFRADQDTECYFKFGHLMGAD